MKRLLITFFVAAAALFTVASCDKNNENKNKTVEFSVQLFSENEAFQAEGVTVELAEASGAAKYEATTDAEGCASFKVPAGDYSASVLYKTCKDGELLVYSGSATFSVEKNATEPFKIDLKKVATPQIIVKEFYSTGCQKGTGTYSDDAYMILYNNTSEEADASDIVISALQPGNAHATNKYYVDGKLLYENEPWILAYSAIWWFKQEVKIPAYSQIVIAIFGSINHSETVPDSVNLDNEEYYWMSNEDISGTFKAVKYKRGSNVKPEHFLTTFPVSAGTSWVISNSSPAIYIGKMDKAEAEALCKDTENYDRTSLTNAKFPKNKVIDCLEVWAADKVANSKIRFSADLNTGYVTISNNLGHTIYRNVDKQATEALPENEGKLVYDYAGGTYDAATGTGSTDPSGIDAEASIANGAHIIYQNTNDSGRDFHERAKSSLKK